MPFTVTDFQDLLRLLREHPDWRAQLWATLAGEELLRLPGEFRAFREETERRFAELTRAIQDLAEAQRRTEERVSRLEEAVTALAEAQRRHYEEFAAFRMETERRFAELAEAQRQMMESQRAMQNTMDRFAQTIGPAVEERMADALQSWIEGQGGALLSPMISMALDGIGEIDGVVRVRFPDGSEGWVLASAKGKAWPRTIQEFVRGILQDPRARAGLRAKGIGDPVWPVVFAMAADERALEAARQAGVGLLLGRQGMVVAPRRWSLEQGEPLPAAGSD
ncbi:MAG TPA: hypothetical protein VNK89_01030 [Thermoflexus sp.]|nr:hypothetical protein [Thermoflexus sp.]